MSKNSFILRIRVDEKCCRKYDALIGSVIRKFALNLLKISKILKIDYIFLLYICCSVFGNSAYRRCEGYIAVGALFGVEYKEWLSR